MNIVRKFSSVTIVFFMVIIQLLESAAVLFTDSKNSAILILLVVNLLITAALLLQYRNYKLRRIDFIREINDEADSSLNATLDNMPIGVIRYNGETLEPEWFNPFVDMIYKGNERVLNKKDIEQILQIDASEINKYVTVGSKKYNINADKEKSIIYLSDATVEASSQDRIANSRSVIASISIDNYDDVTDLITDSERSQVNNFISGALEAFGKEYGLFIRRINANRYYFFCNYRILSNLMEDKFKILEEFRESAIEQKYSLTLSMGISYGWSDYPAIGKMSLNNLELALVRGGDQVVLRENTPQSHPVYYGGNSESHMQKSRTRARAVAGALRTLINESDNVIIVGHRYPDMDAFGAAIAMKTFTNMTGKEAFVVYDEEQLLPDVRRAIDKINQDADGYAHILRLDSIKEHQTKNSLLIMVDHSKVSQTLSLDLYQSFDKVVVVDHHRRDDDFPEHALLNYIESSASSASELATELLQFHGVKERKMSNLEASIILAGIAMDTQHFTKSTTARTFEAAAYLRQRGADNDLIKMISATDFEEYKKVNELVLDATFLEGGIAITCGRENKKYDNITTAKAADNLLDMAGISASFTITHHENGYVSISARSRNGYNVQTLMEAMGGGGHFNNAATQIYEKTISQIEEDLIKLIKERVEN
ncbi:MAG: DHH family phosphoesterase, partial [Streptococcaceae bacterium]|nr:DHH family phosphoesterase [Streptococcaceae bacterium]